MSEAVESDPFAPCPSCGNVPLASINLPPMVTALVTAGAERGAVTTFCRLFPDLPRGLSRELVRWVRAGQPGSQRVGEPAGGAS